MSGKIARFSALPVLQFCGQGQLLGETLGAGRAAAIGTAFHAKCSADPAAELLLARLTDEEREDVAAMQCPTPVEVEGVTFEYATADKEVPVALSKAGAFVAPDYVPEDEVLVRGTLDFAWIAEFDGRRVALVGDLKRTIYACPDGPASLQVIGYAIAYSALVGADGYYTLIWDCTEGEWSVSEYVDGFSEQAELNWLRVKGSALNHGKEYSLGSHCTNCYGRKRCPQWLLPLDLAGTQLEPFTKPEALTHEHASAALLLAKRAEDTADVVRDLCKAMARDTGGILDGKGKKWAPVRSKGKLSLDRSTLEKENPDIVERYTVRGAPYETFRWIKDK